MILCCGEALIDMIPVEAAGGRTAFVPHPGGAIFNTAIALARLDVDTGLLSGVSRDAFGALLADTLDDNGVSTAHLIRSDRLTTLAMVHLKDGSADYAFYDENSAGRMVTPQDLPDLPDSIDALYFGGISLVAEPAAEAYSALLDRSYRERVVMIDPNIRPSFVTDETSYRTRLDRMIRQSDILKVSDEDLQWLTPGSGSLQDKAQAFLGKGPSVVIVTQGAAGATAYFGASSMSVPALPAKVVDTVGAGDTFNAGVLCGLADRGCLTKRALATISGPSMAHALTLGAKVSAITVSRAGANPPWASELGR